MTTSETVLEPRSRPSGRWGRRCAVGAAVCAALLVPATGVLWWWKPWITPIEVVDPGAGGVRIDEAGVRGNFYPTAGGAAPGILVLGGSEGGISAGADAMARALADEGFSALVLSYFGRAGEATVMDEIPLERFDSALDWLAGRPEITGGLAVVGGSKGGEAAVLLGTRRPDLRAVVGLTPSNVVWQGFDLGRPWRTIGSTWSSGGAQVPYLPNGSYHVGQDLVAMYREGLAAIDEHPDAVIPIETATAPYLLVCGEADVLWPACEMSEQIRERSDSLGGPPVTVLSYPDAGHLGVGPPVPADSPMRDGLDQVGGSVEGNADARADSWPQVVAFLRQNLSDAP